MSVELKKGRVDQSIRLRVQNVMSIGARGLVETSTLSIGTFAAILTAHVSLQDIPPLKDSLSVSPENVTSRRGDPARS